MDLDAKQMSSSSLSSPSPPPPPSPSSPLASFQVDPAWEDPVGMWSEQTAVDAMDVDLDALLSSSPNSDDGWFQNLLAECCLTSPRPAGAGASSVELITTTATTTTTTTSEIQEVAAMHNIDTLNLELASDLISQYASSRPASTSSSWQNSTDSSDYTQPEDDFTQWLNQYLV
ncbi:hypothetical protein BC567DRAFT_268341 [Phyllosticta citribraziliensis]